MIITRETKERFVNMLYKHQIIVIQCNKRNSDKTYRYKFIGADTRGRWDFTPLIAEISGYPSNGSQTVQYLSVRGNDAAAIIADTLNVLREEKIFKSKKSQYDLYSEVYHLICTFFIG